MGFSNYDEYLALPQKTAEALNNGEKTIFQGRFEADKITCVFDVLDRTDDGRFDLIEIKASTKVKPEHEYDLAFQALVLKKAGIKLRKIKVIHVNKEYVRSGEIEPEALTISADVTGAVDLLAGETQIQIAAALGVLKQNSKPDLSPRYVNLLKISETNWFDEWLKIYKHLKPNLPVYSIYNLSYPSGEQIGQLEDRGVELIAQVPEELALRPKQAAQIRTTKTGQRMIKPVEIRGFIKGLKYPLYFLDYETLSGVVPAFDGYGPYQDYPFQYSLRYLAAPGSELLHREYLHSENSDPVPPLLKQLKADIGDRGTILAWNMSYEKGCNERMAKLRPEYREFLEQVNGRIKDLMTPFAKMWLVDKDFYGSASVKKVLPVLVPKLSYKDLAIGDGLLARRLWTETILRGENPEKIDQILNDLKSYCTLDTLAMVEILRELKKMVS